MISFLSLALAVISYAISQLSQQGQVRWKSKDPIGFWGEAQDRRKYKNFSTVAGERFKFSTTWLVFLTDGYHFMQFWMFNFLALSFTLTKEWDWYLFISLMIGIRIIHWIGRKLFSK